MTAVDECGFDPDQWSEPDARSTLGVVGEWFRELAAGAPEDLRADLHADAEVIAGIDRKPATYDDALTQVHAAWHALDHAGRIRHRDTAPQRATVVQVNASGGGVPKLPVSGPAEIGWAGLTSDTQADRHHHGRPWQAICLWSLDVIETLGSEGHPIAAGLAGENITIRGLDWPAITPGVRIRIGTAVLETTAYSTPCKKNAPWFSGGEFRRMDQDLHPGWSRIYARVLAPGVVQVGDEVDVLP